MSEDSNGLIERASTALTRQDGEDIQSGAKGPNEDENEDENSSAEAAPDGDGQVETNDSAVSEKESEVIERAGAAVADDEEVVVDTESDDDAEPVESEDGVGVSGMEESAEAGETLDLDFADRDRADSSEIFESDGDSDDEDLADEVPKPALNREVATFSFEKGPVSVKITPQSSQDGLNWTISIYSRGVQGPLLQSSEPLSREQAVEVGIDEDTRERINMALEFAQQELSLPPTFRSETPKKSLSDLEQLMEERAELFKT